MAWFSLIVAGVLEVVWAYGMKRSQGFTQVGPSVVTAVAMLASYGLLSQVQAGLSSSVVGGLLLMKLSSP